MYECNYGLNMLGFKTIRENQQKVVKAYCSGCEVSMIAQKGSGKSLFGLAFSPVKMYWQLTILPPTMEFLLPTLY